MCVKVSVCQESRTAQLGVFCSVSLMMLQLKCWLEMQSAQDLTWGYWQESSVLHPVGLSKGLLACPGNMAAAFIRESDPRENKLEIAISLWPIVNTACWKQVAKVNPPSREIRLHFFKGELLKNL